MSNYKMVQLDLDYISYDEFLAKRRKLMADKIKKYYNSL